MVEIISIFLRLYKNQTNFLSAYLRPAFNWRYLPDTSQKKFVLDPTFNPTLF